MPATTATILLRVDGSTKTPLNNYRSVGHRRKNQLKYATSQLPRSGTQIALVNLELTSATGEVLLRLHHRYGCHVDDAAGRHRGREDVHRTRRAHEDWSDR